MNVNELIRSAAKKAEEETEHAPNPRFVGDLEWPVSVELRPGLEGAVACSTNIGYVNGSKGWLVYRGYDCFDLAEHSTFEETCYLLLFGALPSRAELDAFRQRLKENRKLAPQVIEVLRSLPTSTAHPMAALRTAVSAAGMLDSSADDSSVEAEREVAVRLLSQVATMTGAIARIRSGAEPVDPREDLDFAANFLYMMTGEEPDELAARVMDISLILHADHGMNASTFTAMVTNSSMSDMYSSITAGIASLKGPLHGGANERVLYQLEEIGSPEKVREWFEAARAQSRKVMGFGHRVYKAYDPRARILGPLADELGRKVPAVKALYETAVELEEVVISELGKERRIFPNVDFYSGLVYRALGIDTPMFTPIFAVSRTSGWAARVLEYLEDNRLFRPRAVYTGPVKAEYVSIDQR